MDREWMKQREQTFLGNVPRPEPESALAGSSMARQDRGLSRKTITRLKNLGYTPGLPFGGIGPPTRVVRDMNPGSPTYGQLITEER